MGEIADDMIEGRCCQLCGQYFANDEHPDQFYEHGYPVVCWECWDDSIDPEDMNMYQRALVRTIT